MNTSFRRSSSDGWPAAGPAAPACPHRSRPPRWAGGALLLAAILWPAILLAGNGALEIRNGYFWDPATASPFIPRGIAYQTWNPPVFADQTFSQIDYDLAEIRRLPANSIRCEIVWNEVEQQQGVFDWSKPDYLVRRAEELGLKLFVVIGFNYAPGWFPPEWKALDVTGQRSVVLNYEHPGARLACSNYIAQVTSRYRDSTAIGAWILGNEYAYFDLWNPIHNDLGYDPFSLASFRAYLSEQYGGSIAALNAHYGTSYSSFNTVPMPRVYPPNRNSPAYLDLTLWREKSVGDYVAVGAVAARNHDPNHLITYSMVGGLFIASDADYTFENARTIVDRCVAAGAPLDFWSINNYAWASFTGELRSGDFGIARHMADSGLPVMISETGHTSTETQFEGAAARQANGLVSQMWESLISGAIGFHIFTWNDREGFGTAPGPEAPFYRERGFGIVYQNRTPKPAFAPVRAAFQRMEEVDIDRLLGGSRDPDPDVLFFWPEAAIMGWPRANQELAFLWSPFKRLGYQPGFLNQAGLQQLAFTNASALLLPRCFQLRPADLDLIATNVLGRGIHLHASGDLPGQFDEFHRANPAWTNHMASLFGLKITASTQPGWDSGVNNPTEYRRMNVQGVQALGGIPADLSDYLRTWKIWHGVAALSGQTYVTQTGLNGSQAPMPALHAVDHATAKAAVNTFALGDLEFEAAFPRHAWDQRRQWLDAIYRSLFRIDPSMSVSGPGSAYVILDYRVCSNGSLLLSLLNAETNVASVTLSAPRLLQGRVVENLTSGGMVPVSPAGTIDLSLQGDGYVLLYAYTRQGAFDSSLINTNASKLWFQESPASVWPNGTGTPVEVGFDLAAPAQLSVRLEARHAANTVLAETSPANVTGRGAQRLTLPVPEPRLDNPHFLSSRQGGTYRLRAILSQAGTPIAETVLPVAVHWGVRPLALPPSASVVPGSTHPIAIAWEDLPSPSTADGGTLLDRVAQYQPTALGQRHYEVVLELRGSGGQVVSQQAMLTHAGNGTNTFQVTVPTTASGPFEWVAYLRPVLRATPHFADDFENRGPGEGWGLLEPWVAYAYSENQTATVLNAGLGTEGFCCHQYAFLVANNPTTVGAYSGFGLAYTYPEFWALPENRADWANWTFSFQFREENGRPCTLELVVNDNCGPPSNTGKIRFLQPYAPGPDGWMTVRVPLSQFVVDPNTGRFNPRRVQGLALNVQMQQKGVNYVGFFDNARLDAPDPLPPVTTSESVFESFEDHCGGDQEAVLLPWGSYTYPAPLAERWAVGVGSENASHGAQAAFLVANVGTLGINAAGFGFYYDFPTPWALPASRAEWSKFRVSYDFLEKTGLPGDLEVQIKSGLNAWIEFKQPFSGTGWKSLSATLDQFEQPATEIFDPTQVRTLVVNIRMRQGNSIYTGFVDNIRFTGPERWRPEDLTVATFHSSVSSAYADTDHDGLSDAEEATLGTSPTLPDTDNDGATDWEEVVCRTDPKAAGDRLRLEARVIPGGGVGLSWIGRVGVVYDVESRSPDAEDNPGFLPVPGLTGFSPVQDGEVVAPSPAPDSPNGVWYRLRARRP